MNGVELSLLPHQWRFLDLDCRFPALVGGKGCGKTHVGIYKAMEAARLNPGLTGILASLTFALLRNAILPELRAIMANHNLYEGLHWSVDSNMVVELPIFSDRHGNPARILLLPVDGRENLKRMIGITAAWAILDEAASMSEEAVQQVSARVRDKKANRPFVAATTTPEGLGYMYQQWVIKAKDELEADGTTEWRYVRARTADNPNLDPGYIDSLRSQYPKHLVAAYLEGHFVPMFEGRAFVFTEHEHVNADAVYQDELPIAICCDFNVSPMSWSLGHDRGGMLWTFGEIVLNNARTEDACAEFLARFGRHASGVTVYGDASGQGRSTKSHRSDYEIIRASLGHMPNLMFRVPPANPGQRDSVNEFNAALKNGHGVIGYQVHPSCKQVIHSLLSTCWDKHGDGLDKEKGVEHLSDGLRYWAHQIRPIHRQARIGDPRYVVARQRTTMGLRGLA